jgi:hypothetical protein
MDSFAFSSAAPLQESITRIRTGLICPESERQNFDTTIRSYGDLTHDNASRNHRLDVAGEFGLLNDSGAGGHVGILFC